MKRLLAFACVVALVIVASSRAATTSGSGQIGGAPTRPLPPPDEGKRIGPVRVIGEGKTYDGWLQIDAYAWSPEEESAEERRQFCVWVEFQSESFPTYGSCLGAGEIERPIAIESISGIVGRSGDTRIGGALTPEVTRVVTSVRDSKARKAYRVQATVAQVTGRLQHELKQASPFGYFFAKLPGNIRTKDIKAIAYDAKGTVVGSTRGLHPHVLHVAALSS